MNAEEKEQMWSEIEDWFAVPSLLRVPQKQIEIYTALQIPERTFYEHSAKPEFNLNVIQKSLNRAKKEFPDVIGRLADNAKDGKEKSIEMFMEYVAEMSKKLDIRSNGKTLKGSVELERLADEVDKKIRESYVQE